MNYPLTVLAVLIAPLVGCGNEQPDVGDSIERESDVTLSDAITIEFSKKACTLTVAEAAKGVQFDYIINVKKELANVAAKPQDIGAASAPGPSGLFPFEAISGGGHSYSLSDIGLGPPDQPKARTIRKGRYPFSLKWDGRNWSGPSDFDNPKGKPFPPGVYKVSVKIIGDVISAEGKQPYAVTGSAVVTLTK